MSETGKETSFTLDLDFVKQENNSIHFPESDPLQ